MLEYTNPKQALSLVLCFVLSSYSLSTCSLLTIMLSRSIVCFLPHRSTAYRIFSRIPAMTVLLEMCLVVVIVNIAVLFSLTMFSASGIIACARLLLACKASSDWQDLFITYAQKYFTEQSKLKNK